MSKNDASLREGALEKIVAEIRTCRTCRRAFVGKAVPGEGSATARVVFVGEAPGKLESETGRPFVGRSGQILRRLIKHIGLREKDVFITSALKYLPVHVTPKPAEVKHGRKHLFAQLDVIKPDIIVLLGRVAAAAMLDRNVEVMKEHGKVIERDGRRYLVAFHPAAALHAKIAKGMIEKDFKKLKKLLG